MKPDQKISLVRSQACVLHSSELETPEEKAGMAENLEQTRKSYDLMAEEYVSRLYDKLEHLPLDCELLERFARAVHDKGLVCDIGCGPGQVARYLHERGVAVVGLDLSPRMAGAGTPTQPRHHIPAGGYGEAESAGRILVRDRRLLFNHSYSPVRGHRCPE